MKDKITVGEYLKSELVRIYESLREKEIMHLNGEISKSQLKKHRALCFNAKRDVVSDIINNKENNTLEAELVWDNEKAGYVEGE